MFARRRDVLEREAERLGALAVRGDVTIPADLERLSSRRSRRSAASTSSSGTAAARPPGRPDVDRDAARGGVRALLLAGGPARAALPAVPRAEPGRPHRLHHVHRREGAARAPRALECVRPGVTGWRRRSPASSARRGSPSTASPRAASTRRAWRTSTPTARRGGSPRSRCGRWGTPHEFGDVVCFLASDRARYLTGPRSRSTAACSGLFDAPQLDPRRGCSPRARAAGRRRLGAVARAVERLPLPPGPCSPRRAARQGAGRQAPADGDGSTTSTCA